ncbi:hypothetical protein HAP94_04990 [Acidithiobacillus ferrivorans]|nr:hypothetical protein [Acidithiobacillus ferrivorans]
MEKLPITVVVAPFVDDVLKYKRRGYPWLYIRDMLVDAGVLSKEVKLVSFRRACLTNLYTSSIEQMQIPIKQSTATEHARPAQTPAPRPLPVNVEEPVRREGYGIPDRSKEESGSSNSMKDELAKMGLVFS